MTTHCQPAASIIQANNLFVVNFTYAQVQAGLSLNCRNSVKEHNVRDYSEESLSTQLVALADQIHRYIAVNHFYYDAVEALLSDSELTENINKHSHYGLTLITHWLCEQDKALLESLAQITSQVASMTDGNGGKSDAS